ncbi:MAG: hypothetical protein Q4G63_07095 [Bacteroidia bacterium]|nr:hypothetical protein [Bacteroidia bacterium]
MKKIVRILLLFFLVLLFGCKQDIPELTPEEQEKQQFEEIIKVLDNIDPIADNALKSENPEEELKKVAEQFKDNPEIEDIYFERDKLILKFKNGGYVGWFIKEKLQPTTRTSHYFEDIKTIKGTRSGENNLYPKILYIYRHTLDKSRANLNEYTRNYINSIIDIGYNITPVYGEDFTLDFARTGLTGYDAVFIDSHGSFDKGAGLTWILTGEKLFEDNDLLIFKERIWHLGHILYDLSGTKDTYELWISQNFIDDNYKDNSFPSNSFWYFGTCQTMMDSKLRFAKVLAKKGASKIVGYDETTFAVVAIDHAHAILDKLLIGESYNQIFSSFNDLGKWLCSGNNCLIQYEKSAKRQEEYSAGKLLRTTNLVSYPADINFRFHILQLAKQNMTIPLVIDTQEEIKIISGSGSYEVTSSNPQVASASVTPEKVIIKALSKGVSRITVTDTQTKLTAMLDVGVITLQQKKIEEIIPSQFVEILKDLNMPFYEGENPPIIEGAYFISPNILSATNKSNDFDIGYQFGDETIRFYDQDNKTFEIKVASIQGNNTHSSIETSVTSGSNNAFTVYGKIRTEDIYDNSIYTIMGVVYSGTLDSQGNIKNFTQSFVMLDKNDPNGKYINVGDARTVIDGDYYSSKTTWPTRSTRSGGDDGKVSSISRKK